MNTNEQIAREQQLKIYRFGWTYLNFIPVSAETIVEAFQEIADFERVKDWGIEIKKDYFSTDAGGSDFKGDASPEVLHHKAVFFPYDPTRSERIVLPKEY